MKIKLPNAEEIRRKQVTKMSVRESSIRQVVEIFLNGPVRSAIIVAMANENCHGVNVEIPIEAYGANRKDFYRLCDENLRQLGYTSSESHDGGGVYSTLYVSWEIKNPRSSKA